MTALVTPFLLAALGAGPTYSLEWKPKAGETHLYRVTVRFTYGDGEIEFDSDLKTTIIGIAADGSYRLETRTLNATATSGDEKHELPPQTPQNQRYDRCGVPLEPRSAAQDKDPFADMLDNLTQFQTPGRPVAIGDGWLNAVAGPKNSFFGAPRISYKFDSLKGSQTATYAFIEYRASHGFDKYAATGNLILQRPNNSLFHLDVNIPHFKPQEADEEAAVKVVIQEK